jgi:hypothetical protein
MPSVQPESGPQMEASQPEGEESRGVVCNDDTKCRRFSDVSDFGPLGKPPLVSFAPTVTLTYWDAEEENTVQALLLDGREGKNTVPALLLDGREEENTVPSLLLDGREEENTVPALLLDGREEENTVPSLLLDGREEENTVPSLLLDGREEENTVPSLLLDGREEENTVPALLLDGREEENTANEEQEEKKEFNNGCPLFLDDKENTAEKTEENTTSVQLGMPETVQLHTASAPPQEAQQEDVKGGSGDLPEKDMEVTSDDGLLEADEIERTHVEAKPLASAPTAKLATFTLTYEDEELSECCSQVKGHFSLLL